MYYCIYFKANNRDFAGSPVVKTLPSNTGGMGLILGWGAEIPQVLQPKNKNRKQKQYCIKFNKTLKMVHIKKSLKAKKNIFINEVVTYI